MAGLLCWKEKRIGIKEVLSVEKDRKEEMNGIERDCVVGRCTSVQHGGQLAAAATMRAGEPVLMAYMRWLCGTCGRITDSLGRTVLHLAASCGQGAVVRWLVRRADAGIDVRDIESGYTALHRSIFYGQIHVAADLIKVSDIDKMVLMELRTDFIQVMHALVRFRFFYLPVALLQIQ